MFKNKKLKQNFNSFFLSIIFEKEIFFFLEGWPSLKNSQFIFFYNFNILKTIKFFYEYKPVCLTDMITYDSYFIDQLEYNINQPTTTFYYFFSYKLNAYKMMYSFQPQFDSIYKIFKNAVWLEREQLEFFGVNFLNMYDCRNLLLEYDYDKHIFLKEFGLCGENNYYSTFYNKIDSIANIYNKI